MAATRGTIGYLGTFNMGSPLAPVLEVKRIRINPVDVPSVDFTHLVSPNATSELKPGIIKPGTIEVDGNFIGDATQLAFLTDAQARTVFAFSVTAPVDNGTKVYTASGSGFVSTYSHGDIEVDKPHEFSVKIQMTGALTEAVA